ncbi:MAG TPA: DUF4233 domain-containing protein [Marmoricola sp.]|nr:DUF4233 domain-containing protein [Marmoricola sp.]
MRRRLCAAILTFEAIVLGLTTPVLISVQGVDRAQALWIGLGLTVVCVLAAGLLRRTWAYGLGWLVQAAAIAMGLQITAMFVLGIVFLALWVAAYVLGGRIDDHEAALESRTEPDEAADVLPPPSWHYELVCSADTYRPFAQRGTRGLLTPVFLLFPVLCVLVAVLLLLFAPGSEVVAGVFVVFAVGWPVVSWLAQRQAWRTFLAPGKAYRTAFLADRIVLESGGRLLQVPYDDLSAVSEQGGLVTATIGAGQARLQLPEPVFPAGERERVRRRLGPGPRADGATA